MTRPISRALRASLRGAAMAPAIKRIEAIARLEEIETDRSARRSRAERLGLNPHFNMGRQDLLAAIEAAGPGGRVVLETSLGMGDPGWNREEWTVGASGAVVAQFDGPGPCDSARRTPAPATSTATPFGAYRVERTS